MIRSPPESTISIRPVDAATAAAFRVTIDFVLGEDCEQSREEWNSAGEEAFRSR
jgi:hypothetical protein